MVCGMSQIGRGLNGYSEQNERAALAEKTWSVPICSPFVQEGLEGVRHELTWVGCCSKKK